MAPTIVTRLRQAVPGSSARRAARSSITTVLQTLLERLELGKDLPGAIATPRVSQRNGATSIAEPTFPIDKTPA